MTRNVSPAIYCGAFSLPLACAIGAHSLRMDIYHPKIGLPVVEIDRAIRKERGYA